MKDYDYLKPAAEKLVRGLSGKPGVRFVDKEMVADWLAQALHGMVKRGEIPLQPVQEKQE